MFPDIFSTLRLSLRPINMDDAQAIFDRYGQDLEVTRYLTWRPHKSIEDTKAYIQMCLNTESSRVYMMVLQSSAKLLARSIFGNPATGGSNMAARSRGHIGAGG